MIILCAEKMPKQKVSLVLPSPCGRAKSLEEALNVLLCLGRGAISIATRGLVGEGLQGDGELTTDEAGLSLYLTQRRQRTQNSNANYVVAEVVAGYARQRAQRKR